MCGRYNLITDAQALIDAFQVINRLDWQPRYNIAPSQNVPAIRQEEGGREAVLLRWGLIPHWAKDEKFGYRTINARSETVAEKPAFRDAFRKRRCLIPATGFYEWRQMQGYKQPYNIRLKNRGLFAFAGLWAHWQSPEGKAIESFTIIVTDANAAVKPIHDRMPVILDLDDYGTWLDPDQQDASRLKTLLKPYPAEKMEYWPVSRRVGNPANDDPALIEPLDLR
jgi:putative SOS response-associated peptidase YedK